MSINRVWLLGSVSRPVEVRYTQDGAASASFTIATERRVCGGAEPRAPERDWHRCVAVGALAELARDQLRAGDIASVEGRLRTRTWKDHAGRERSFTEVVVEDVQRAGRERRPAAAEETATPAPARKAPDVWPRRISAQADAAGDGGESGSAR
jgi:single-strand DNA-binding protein